jgi:hypothetical protein
MNIGEYCPLQYIILHSQACAIWYNDRDNIHQYSCNHSILSKKKCINHQYHIYIIIKHLHLSFNLNINTLRFIILVLVILISCKKIKFCCKYILKDSTVFQMLLYKWTVPHSFIFKFYNVRHLVIEFELENVICRSLMVLSWIW